MSSNLNSKRTVLPKPEKILDAKATAPEMDQASVVTAPASEAAEKCATAEPLSAEAPKVELPVEAQAEPEAPEVKVAEKVDEVAPEEDSKPAVVTEEKPAAEEAKPVEVPASEEAKPEVTEEAQPVVEITEKKESKKRSIDQISNQEADEIKQQMQLAAEKGSKRMKVAEPEQEINQAPQTSTEALPEAQALATPVAVVEEKPAETQSSPEEAKPAVEEAVIESPPSVVKDVAAPVETNEAAEAPMPKKDEDKAISSTTELEKAYINEMAKESVKAPETEDAEKVEAQKWRNLNLKEI